jgi:hypothetical protein
LRWYESGVRATNSLDQFIAFFVAIEAILNAYEKAYGPIPAIQYRIERNKRQPKQLLKRRVDPEVYEGAIQAVSYVSNRDRMVFFAARENMDESFAKQFKKLADRRADILHSRTVEADDTEVISAKKLLVTMLKRELAIEGSVPWETLPQIGEIRYRHFDAALGKRYGQADS